jgi:multisubunit Na+/H+ antiporter MnhB subunit
MLVEGIAMVLFGLFFIALSLWWGHYLDSTDQEIYRVWHPAGTLLQTRERATIGAAVFLIVGVIFLVLGIVILLI